jgi:hypothetical protein
VTRWRPWSDGSAVSPGLASTVIMSGVTASQSVSGGVPSGFAALQLTQRNRRILGVVLLAVLLVIAVGFIDLRHLDTVRDEVGIATSVDAARSGVPADQVSSCFQGFCFEDDVGAFERGWRFATTYLRLIGWSLVVSILAVAIVDTLLIRHDRRRLRSATTPVGAATAVAIVVLFSPLVAAVALGLGLVAALGLRRLAPSAAGAESVTDSAPESIGSALREVVIAAAGTAVRLVPWFVLAAAVGGFGAQILTLETVEAVVGDHLIGIAVVTIVGLAIGPPRLVEIPLVAAGLLLGMGSIAASVLLFGLAVTGPLRLQRVGGRGLRVAALAAITVIATGGGTLALSASTLIETATVPTITYDGAGCTYTGPARIGPRVHDFTIVNDTEDAGIGHTMAVVVGRLPDNVSIDHFAATVAADPTAPLPEWFTVAGTQEFIFPGTEQVTEMTFHDPGAYASVCLSGGSFYVIFEFSMPQPMGWFDEFRSAFDGYVAEATFEVAG